MIIKQFWIDNTQYIKTALWLFAAGLIAGLTAAFYYPGIMEQIVEAFSERFGENPELGWQLVQDIFVQNITASFVAWVGGLLFGVIPAVALLFNGFVLGYISTFIILNSPEKIATLGFLAAGLLPHGIIEIPVFIAAAVLGLRLGVRWLTESAKGQRLNILWKEFNLGVRYFLWITIGLILAAVIEVFISGNLVNNF